MPLPLISVVIPAYNASLTLGRCLQALASSEIRVLECLVVDDGSTDGTPEIARQFGAKVLTTGGRKGPAYARNMGAREACGDVIFFIDADVCIQPGTTSRLCKTFEQEPAIAGVIGCYDDSPHAQDVVSMYRNLLHRYIHQNSRRDAFTFWSGCGAIRREVFLESGGFDESFDRPSIEDIEFGYRLTTHGRRLLLDCSLQVKHLKRWEFINLVKTDVFDRAIPWTKLILRDRRMPNDLNLRVSHRLSVALALVLFGVAVVNTYCYGGLFVVPCLAVILSTLTSYWTKSGVARNKGMNIGLMGLGAAFVGLAYTYHMLTLIYPVLAGYIALIMRYRYAYNTKFQRQLTGIAYGLYLLATFIFFGCFIGASVPVLFFYALILPILAINGRFYLYLTRGMGWLTTLSAVPFHLMFCFYSGAGFIAGVMMFSWNAATRRRDHNDRAVQFDRAEREQFIRARDLHEQAIVL